jgi:hypothetical protein
MIDEVETRIDVLVWSDIVRDSMAQSPCDLLAVDPDHVDLHS